MELRVVSWEMLTLMSRLDRTDDADDAIGNLQKIGSRTMALRGKAAQSIRDRSFRMAYQYLSGRLWKLSTVLLPFSRSTLFRNRKLNFYYIK